MIAFVELTLELIAILMLMSMFASKLLTKNPLRIAVAFATLIIGYIIQVTYIKEVLKSDVIGECWIILLVFVIALIMSEISKGKCIVLFIITELILGIIHGLLSIVFQYFNVFGINNDIEKEILAKICTVLVVTIISFIVVVLIKKSININEIPKKHFVVIGIMFISTVILMCAISLYMSSTDSSFHTFIVVCVVFVCVTVFGVALEIIVLEFSKKNLEKENGMLHNYNEQQQRYYELLLKKEEDTRRYRHDMLNHMICINDLLDNGSIDEVKEYLSNITNDLSSVKKDLYHSGNRIADVIMTNVFSNKSEDTKVTILGQLYPDMGISDYDMCIVLSNILKNAVEAVNRQSETSEKYIRVKFSKGKRFFRIEEWNSIDKDQVQTAQSLETSKNDKHRHGLGTKNIRLIAEKYNGDFTTQVKENEFYICVDLDLKQPKS